MERRDENEELREGQEEVGEGKRKNGGEWGGMGRMRSSEKGA